MQIFSSIKDMNKKRNVVMRLFFLNQKLKLRKLLSKKTDFQRDEISSILLWTGKGLGDCILISGLIHALRSSGYKIIVLTEKNTAFVFESMIAVDGVVVVGKGKIPAGRYDLLIDLNDNAHKIASKLRVLLSSKVKYSIGFNTTVYDVNIDFNEYQRHFSERFKPVLHALNLDGHNASEPVINIDHESKFSVAEWLKKSAGERTIVVFCPFASNKTRSFSVEQCKAILKYWCAQEKYYVILLGSAAQIAMLPNELAHLYVSNPFSSFTSAISIIEKANIVVSVDTTFVHIARAYNKKLIAIYNNRIIDGKFENNHVFSPDYANATQLFTSQYAKTALGDEVSSFDINKLIISIENAADALED